jgi:hypothetical protein
MNIKLQNGKLVLLTKRCWSDQLKMDETNKTQSVNVNGEDDKCATPWTAELLDMLMTVQSTKKLSHFT